MKQKEFLLLVKQTSADGVHRILEGMDETERSACATGAIALHKQVDRWTGGGGSASDPQILDCDAAVAAVLGTASFEDILSLKRLPLPLFASPTDIYGRFKLPWLQDAVEQMLHPDDVSSAEPLWRDGLCSVPSCDALVHAYFDHRQSGSLDEGVLLNGLVWRFFETFGKGYNSLPVHDRESEGRLSMGHTGYGTPWAERLLSYERSGVLDRERLLCASLGAIAAMSRPAEAKWFRQFFISLAPTRKELIALHDPLDELTRNPATVKSAFAKRILKTNAMSVS